LIESAATFNGLVDLASASLGGRALGTSDDFFAGIENLVQPGRGVFIEGKFTDRGKWMDGWESRRKRVAGYDWCILELGATGRAMGFDVDTNHFVGNCPAFVSIDGLSAPRGTPVDALAAMLWTPLLAQAPVRPSAQNLFVSASAEPVSHVRLNIFPDGGVARFRVYGRVLPDWGPPDVDSETRTHVPAGLVDLAAVRSGGLALACSDAFFGPMNNLLLPGRAENMGGGWETRRKRAPGHDWILLQLGARGNVAVVEVDTNHFKGNYPDRCSIDWIDAAPGTPVTELVAITGWGPLLPETKLSAHTRHFLGPELLARPAASHLRLNIFPDGGISRLRAWGTRAEAAAPGPQGATAVGVEPHERLNAASEADAAALLVRCCGSTRWVQRMLASRPFASRADLLRAAEEAWEGLDRGDYLEAFAHHPRLGADPAKLREKFAAADLSSAEQARVTQADPATLDALRDANAAYERRFGFVFLLCATGKGAPRSPGAPGAAHGQRPQDRARRGRRRTGEDHPPAPGKARVTTVSSHALDTTLGQPARGLPVRLDVLDASGQWSEVARARTDDDGRVRRFVDGALAGGTYRVTFDTRAYLEATGQPVFYPWVDVVFIATGDAHYHVPLLISPHGYSTYRGS
jgi:allantoicase